MRQGQGGFGVIAMFAIAASASLFAQKTQPLREVELSQQETELRVKMEIGRRAGVRAEAVRVVETGARTWPDAGLGCTARRGVLDPSPIPGYRIVAEADGRRFVYHTDRYGRLLRCSLPGKPVGPASSR